MSMPIIFRKSVYLLMFSAGSLVTYTSGAQSSEISAPNLQLISKEMFNTHNSGFILVQALADNLITTGTRYDFNYETGKPITVNGKAIPEPLQAQYAVLLHDFYAKDPGALQSTSLHMAGEKIEMKEVLDPLSGFRSKESLQEDYSSVIVNEMAAEKLIDTTVTTKIIYNSSGIFVNGQRLSEALETKYKSRFKELAFTIPVEDGDQISIEQIPDAPKGKKRK